MVDSSVWDNINFLILAWTNFLFSLREVLDILFQKYILFSNKLFCENMIKKWSILELRFFSMPTSKQLPETKKPNTGA